LLAVGSLLLLARLGWGRYHKLPAHQNNKYEQPKLIYPKTNSNSPPALETLLPKLVTAPTPPHPSLKERLQSTFNNHVLGFFACGLFMGALVGRGAQWEAVKSRPHPSASLLLDSAADQGHDSSSSATTAKDTQDGVHVLRRLWRTLLLCAGQALVKTLTRNQPAPFLQNAGAYEQYIPFQS
jgi:hypothetical protein